MQNLTESAFFSVTALCSFPVEMSPIHKHGITMDHRATAATLHWPWHCPVQCWSSASAVPTPRHSDMFSYHHCMSYLYGYIMTLNMRSLSYGIIWCRHTLNRCVLLILQGVFFHPSSIQSAMAAMPVPSVPSVPAQLEIRIVEAGALWFFLGKYR